jgi:hypothetical protein
MAESSVKFLADENISPVLVEIIRKLGDRSLSSIHRYSDYLGTPDEHWVPLATKREYIIVTCDRRMLIKHGISQALETTGARCIFLARNFADANRWNQALWLIRYWPKIRKHAETMGQGNLVRVTSNCRILTI